MPNKEDESVKIDLVWSNHTRYKQCAEGKDETHKDIHEEILEERCINTM